MKIASCETGSYRVPLSPPWASAAHAITHLELVIARVRTEAGDEGVGWSYTVGVGGTAAEAFLADELRPRLVGRDPSAVERIWQDLAAVARDGGGGVALLALAAVDVALWDLRARALGLPLFRLLGASRERVPAYGSGVNLNLALDELLAQVRRWRARGYTAIKIKVGSEDPAADVERVRAVREALGAGGALMADANQKWTVGEAARRIGLLEPFGLHWIEEPLPAEDLAGHEALRGRIRTPVALGENLCTARAFAEYLRRSAVDVV